jgi:hypothetical protein
MKEEEYTTATAEADLKLKFKDYLKENLFDDEMKGEGFSLEHIENSN